MDVGLLIAAAALLGGLLSWILQAGLKTGKVKGDLEARLKALELEVATMQQSRLVQIEDCRIMRAETHQTMARELGHISEALAEVRRDQKLDYRRIRKVEDTVLLIAQKLEVKIDREPFFTDQP